MKKTMKCPVCNMVANNDSSKCGYCGFSEIETEFINQEDYERWMTDTVIPCRCVFQKMSKKLDIADKKNEELQSKYDALDALYGKLKNSPVRVSNTLFGSNDVVFEDENVKLVFVEWGRGNYLVGGWARTATFVFENKTGKRLCIFLKDISVAGYLNQEESLPTALAGKQKQINPVKMIIEDKVPGNINDYESVEFSICYGEIAENLSSPSYITGPRITSKTVSLGI